MATNNKITFVKADAEHVDEMHEIEEQVFPTPWSYNSLYEDVVNHKSAYYTVGLVNGKVISYAGFWFVIDEAHITNVAVKPEFRRKGIGKKMMELLLAEAKRRGIVTISLEVRQGNTVARNLYTGLGFRANGLRKRYYQDNGEDAVLMSLFLRPVI